MRLCRPVRRQSACAWGISKMCSFVRRVLLVTYLVRISHSVRKRFFLIFWGQNVFAIVQICTTTFRRFVSLFQIKYFRGAQLRTLQSYTIDTIVASGDLSTRSARHLLKLLI